MNANDLASLIPLVLLLVFAYLVLIRPARRRAHEVHAVQSALSPGDEVMLTSGIFGTVSTVGDERLSLQLVGGVEIEVARAAVAKILRDVPADAAAVESGETAPTEAAATETADPHGSDADAVPGTDASEHDRPDHDGRGAR